MTFQERLRTHWKPMDLQLNSKTLTDPGLPVATNRIDSLFQRLREQGRKAIMPFVTAGDPDLATTAVLINELIARGADLIEVGIPYSDPIADGPVIAASYHRALMRGVKVAHIFQTMRTLRAEGSARLNEAPMVAMVSYAIVIRLGIDRFLNEAATAGFDGLIVPDLPLEESEGLLEKASHRDLKLIQLITPTTPRDRAVAIARRTTGFIYYVSVAGITGERTSIPPEVADDISWLREQTDLPICIGFGISQPEHIRQLAPLVDGLIVGSALVRRLAEAINLPRQEVVREIGDFVSELAAAAAPDSGQTS
jgi:tryptophan synthase alpha chain